MGNRDGDVIDLTDSFTLIDHCSLANEIIEIDTDDSFITTPTVNTKELAKTKKSTINKKVGSTSSNFREKLKTRKSGKFGNCPICWGELGKNPLASTKCGHVYCLKCLEQSLRVEKRCPSCRTLLKGSTAYHPLYLSMS